MGEIITIVGVVILLVSTKVYWETRSRLGPVPFKNSFSKLFALLGVFLMAVGASIMFPRQVGIIAAFIFVIGLSVLAGA